MAEDQTKVDVVHDGKDTTINILHKDAEDVTPTEENNMAFNINLDAVEVKTANAYVDLNAAVIEGDGQLKDSELKNIGKGQLCLTLECGDQIIFDAEKLAAIVIKAADLPVASE